MFCVGYCGKERDRCIHLWARMIFVRWTPSIGKVARWLASACLLEQGIEGQEVSDFSLLIKARAGHEWRIPSMCSTDNAMSYCYSRERLEAVRERIVPASRFDMIGGFAYGSSNRGHEREWNFPVI
jgi:hypothetical protein